MFCLLTFLIALLHQSFCFLNLEEIRSFNYDIDILSTPVKTGEETRQSVMLMTSKFGQDYQCSLPEEPSSSDSGDASTDEVDVPSVTKLLEPLRNGPCLTKTKNWWTYELCYGLSIKQFHIENGKPEGAVIYLGLYDSDFDWDNTTNLEQFNKSGQQKYHSQIYSRGSNCDITGVHRKSEVRYYCEEDSADYIYSVEEPETCSYIFTIHTSRVCSFPPLKPPASSKPHTIHCSPLLSEEQFQKYLEIKEKEKQAEEEKRKIWLLGQQNNLAAIKAAMQRKQEDLPEQDHSEDTDEKPESKQDKPSGQEDEQENQGGIDTGEWEKEPSEKAEHDADHSQYTTSTDVLSEDTDSTTKSMQEDGDEHSLDSARELKSTIAEQFKELLNEAEQELQDEAYGQFKESYLKLDSTIERLMKQITEAEESVVKETDQSSEGFQEEGQKDKSPSKDFSNPASEDEESSAESLPPKKGDEEGDDDEEAEQKELDAESETTQRKNVLDDGKLRVRIRRIDVRQLAKAKDKGTYKEQELHSEDKTKLETALRERLQKAGLDTEGRKIEVKIITAGFFDDDEEKDLKVLSPEETQQFQNMIVTLLMGNQEAIQEVERQERLEKNYQFVWGENLDGAASENEDSDR